MRMQSAEQTTLIFELRDGRRIEIAASVLQVTYPFRQTRSNQAEAGGILLGRLIDGSGDVVIDEATAPDKADRRSRFNFFRSKKTAQGRVNAAWEETGQTRNYLGEWHTHPEDCPTPSGHDIENWRRIVKKSKFEQDSLIFVIVGRTTTKAWILRKGENQPVELQAASESKCANKRGSQ